MSESTINTDSTTESREQDPGRTQRPRNIVICCDGTGNVGGAVNPTNVWRIRQAVALTNGDPTDERDQVVIYQDGVGTSSFRPLEIIGKAFSWGITGNLEELYAKLVTAYRPGDRIYLFGFSRGAFTARLFANLLYRCGLADNRAEDGRPLEPNEIKKLAELALQAYKLRHVPCTFKTDAKKNEVQSTLDQKFRIQFGLDPSGERSDPLRGESETDLEHRGRIPIEFIGVWDTVSSVGLPFHHATQFLMGAWRWVTKRSAAFRWACYAQLNFHRAGHWVEWQDDDLTPMIRNAFHALSIDDEREAFWPVLWNEFEATDSEKKKSRKELRELEASKTPLGVRKKANVQQVWFAGSHSNVGGGYAKDEVAFVSLNWMMQKAFDAGLNFEKSTWQRYIDEIDDLGEIGDSRAGASVYYRYKLRRIAELSKEVGLTGSQDEDRKPKIHESVFRRIAESTDQYSPLGLPVPGEYVEVKSSEHSFFDGDANQESRPGARGYVPDVLSNSASTEQRWMLQNPGHKSRSNEVAPKALDSQDTENAESAKNVESAEGNGLELQERLKERSEIRDKMLEITSGYARLRRALYYAMFGLTIAALLVGFFGSRPGIFSELENMVYGWVAKMVDALKSLVPDALSSLWNPIVPIMLTPPLIIILARSIASWRQSKIDRPGLAESHPVKTILIRGIAFMLVAMILRPLVHFVATSFIPIAGERLVGVLGSPLWFALFAMSFYLVLSINGYFQFRMHEWAQFAWRVSQGKSRSDGMEPNPSDRFAEGFSQDTWWTKFFDRWVVPAVAVIILSCLLLYPVWITIEDVVVRMRLSAVAEASKESKRETKETRPEPSKAWRSFPFATKQVLDTKLHVRDNVMYVIEVDRKTDWTDGKGKDVPIVTTSNGIADDDLKPFQKLAARLKRVPDDPYFGLCVAVDDPIAPAQTVHDGVPFTVSRPGRLYIMVNDVPGFHFNNHGTAEIKIRRVYATAKKERN